jgi:hypothetical protein
MCEINLAAKEKSTYHAEKSFYYITEFSLDWHKIFVNHITNTRFVPKYKEFIQLNKRKTPNNLIKNEARTFLHLSKEKWVTGI